MYNLALFAVILLPYGLSGNLTGHHFREDSATNKLLDEWNSFFHVPEPELWDNSGELPKVLEVTVGKNHRLF